MTKRKTIQRSARWAALSSRRRKAMRQAIAERDGCACHHCGIHTKLPAQGRQDPEDMTIDHWPIPRSNLPEKEWLNPSRAVIACLSCNRRMNDEQQKASA